MNETEKLRSYLRLLTKNELTELSLSDKLKLCSAPTSAKRAQYDITECVIMSNKKHLLFMYWFPEPDV